jgi:hypothetical protein
MKSTMTVICLCAFQIPLDLNFTEETPAKAKVPRKNVTLLITFADPSPDFRLRDIVVRFRLDVAEADDLSEMVSIPFYCV